MVILFITFLSITIFGISALVLFFKASPIKRANVRLGWLTVVLSSTILILTYKHEALRLMSYHLLSYYIPIEGCLLVIIGPCVYLYLMEIFNIQLYFWTRRVLLHFVAVIPSLLIVLQFASETTAVRVARTIHGTIKISWQTHIVIGTFVLQMLSYLIFFYFYVRKQLSKSSPFLKESDRKFMIKLKNAFLLNFVLIILSTIYYFSINNVALAVNIGLVILFIQFFYFLIVSIWQNLLIRNDIIQLEHPEQIEQLDLILENIISDNKQPKILVSDEVADKYITIILEIMAKDKPYLQTAYSIQQLAESTDIPLHHISNCLNIRLNKSFTEFINEYRVAVAIELLKDPAYSNLTIEAIALDCGFGSKKSFNTAFKKLTLLTPSEYRK